jgi:hypothetical protein
LGWLLFFIRYITALPQPKSIGKIFIQIQVFAELWVSWAGLNLLLIFPMWGNSSRSHWDHQPNQAQPWRPVKKIIQKFG